MCPSSYCLVLTLPLPFTLPLTLQRPNPQNPKQTPKLSFSLPRLRRFYNGDKIV